jgi:ketosteroid isomerase-like protein
MRCAIIFLILLSFFAAASLAQRPSVAPLSPAAQASIWEQDLRDADTDFAKQTAARGLEGWMSFFAPDATIIHDGQTVTGTQALRAFYAPIFANKNFSLAWKPTHAEASADGTLGYTYGTYEAKNGDASSHGMYTTVWRRVNGQWKVVLDLGSAMPSQSAPGTQNNKSSCAN